MEEKYSDKDFDSFISSNPDIEDIEGIEIRKDLKKLDTLLKEVTKVAKSCTPKKETATNSIKTFNKLKSERVDSLNFRKERTISILLVNFLTFVTGLFLGHLLSSSSNECEKDL